MKDERREKDKEKEREKASKQEETDREEALGGISLYLYSVPDWSSY